MSHRRKGQPNFTNFKEHAKFRTRKKKVVSLKVSRIMNKISEQKISHVTEVYITADLYQARPDKPKIFWRYGITMPLIVHEYTDVPEETFPSYKLNFYFYFYFYTYTWQRMPITKVNNKKKNDKKIKMKKK